MMRKPVAPWLWRGGVGLLAVILAVGSILVAALALGWNTPRPPRPPDWQSPDLPITLAAPPDAASAALLEHAGGVTADDDFSFEVEAALLSSAGLDGYGLIYRAQDTDHYYAFAVGSDGYYAVLRVEGSREIPLLDWQQFPHVRRGRQANRLRVACEGPTCRFYVNDEYAATVEDNRWSAGDVGLWVRSFADEGVTATFQGARLWVDE